MSTNQFNYLKALKKLNESPLITKRTYILGNTSVDMDSVLAAYLLAIGKNMKEKIIYIDENNEIQINEKTDKIYYPILNCKRGTYHHRLDGQYVFEKFKIDENDFLYSDDEFFSEEKIKSTQNTNFILVDHSLLDSKQKYLSPYIIEVIDHHIVPSYDFPNLKDRCIQYPIGSCTTLVLLNYFVKNFPLMFISPLFSVTAILLDTENFKESFYGNRWVDLDKIVLDLIIKYSPIDVNITEYYKKVQGEKTNVERNLALGIDVLFEKDKKTFDWEKNKVEWSAIPVSYLKVMDKFNYNSLNDYFDRLKNERKYYVSNSVLDSGDKLMTVYSFDNFNGVNRDNIQNKLKEKYGDNLKDLKFDDEKKTLFIQLPNTSSRKSTEPIFRYIFNE
jgi:inorganic pyrophosphatase/exopolyphosphatase